jgi:hypothetical protein
MVIPRRNRNIFLYGTKWTKHIQQLQIPSKHLIYYLFHLICRLFTMPYSSVFIYCVLSRVCFRAPVHMLFSSIVRFDT